MRWDMRVTCMALVGLAFLVAVPVSADEDAEARAVIAKALKAMGGEEQLSKFKAFSAKIKGDIYMGEAKLPFAGELVSQGAEQQKIALELDVGGQKILVTQ